MPVAFIAAAALVIAGCAASSASERRGRGAQAAEDDDEDEDAEDAGQPAPPRGPIGWSAARGEALCRPTRTVVPIPRSLRGQARLRAGGEALSLTGEGASPALLLVTSGESRRPALDDLLSDMKALHQQAGLPLDAHVTFDEVTIAGSTVRATYRVDTSPRPRRFRFAYRRSAGTARTCRVAALDPLPPPNEPAAASTTALVARTTDPSPEDAPGLLRRQPGWEVVPGFVYPGARLLLGR